MGGQPELFAKGRVVAVVDADVVGQRKDDVLDSLAFATAAADAKADVAQDPVAWLDQYRTALANLGWGGQDFQFRTVTSTAGNAAPSPLTVNSLTCLVTDSGHPTLRTFVVLDAASQDGTRNIEVSDATSVLDEQVYAPLRESIKERIPPNGRYMPLI